MSIRIKAPRLAATCARCGRKLDGRVVGNPFGQWSIPTYSASGWWPSKEAYLAFARRRGGDLDDLRAATFCGYCYEIIARNWDALTQLKPDCKAAEQLTQWLAQPRVDGRAP